MLVLTRKIQEAVVVGEDNGPHRVLKVTVLAIRGGRVKLGFEVDTDVPIQRWEVWQRVRDGTAADPASGDSDLIPGVNSGRQWAIAPTAGGLGMQTTALEEES
jgi:carbon storage regulator CsrA